MAGSKERERRRARERFERQRALQLAHRRKIRQRALIVVAVLWILNVIPGPLALAFYARWGRATRRGKTPWWAMMASA